MEIRLADLKDLDCVLKYDCHIPVRRLEAAIKEQFVSVLSDNGHILGVLRYNLFWQTIPFLDLLYVDESCRGKGYGSKIMKDWESTMRSIGYSFTMLSTQADETAKDFYEKIGYHRVGAFLPPEQTADELMYLKELK